MKCNKCNIKMNVVDTRSTGVITYRKVVCKTCGTFKYTKETYTDRFEAFEMMDKIREESRNDKMTGNKYQELASRTINHKLTHVEQKYHALHGMVGEIGEIHSLFQKIYQGHDMEDEHLQKEVGDLLWFIAEFCTCQGWNLDDIMQMNIDKLKARFPEGFEVDKSLNRKEGDI